MTFPTWDKFPMVILGPKWNIDQPRGMAGLKGKKKEHHYFGGSPKTRHRPLRGAPSQEARVGKHTHFDSSRTTDFPNHHEKAFEYVTLRTRSNPLLCESASTSSKQFTGYMSPYLPSSCGSPSHWQACCPVSRKKPVPLTVKSGRGKKKRVDAHTPSCSPTMSNWSPNTVVLGPSVVLWGEGADGAACSSEVVITGPMLTRPEAR